MQPTPYNPAVDFSEEEALAVAGRSSLRTAKLDTELQAIATSINQIRANLAILQRDDELLRDRVVKAHTLDTDVLALIATACTPRGDWATETNYGVGDIVLFSDLAYLSLQAHVSGIFLDDRAAGKWINFTGLPYADIISSDPGKGASLVAIEDALGLLTGANVEEALAEIITALNTFVANLASASAGQGGALVKIESGQTVQEALNDRQWIRLPQPATYYAGGAYPGEEFVFDVDVTGTDPKVEVGRAMKIIGSLTGAITVDPVAVDYNATVVGKTYVHAVPRAGTIQDETLTAAVGILPATDSSIATLQNNLIKSLIKQALRWTSPVQLGAGLAVASVNPAITTLDGNNIAWIDDVAGQLRTYNWDGHAWALAGSSLTLDFSPALVAICAINSTDVVVSSGAVLRVFRWNGSTWAQIGVDYSVIGSATVQSICRLTDTDIVRIDAISDNLRTYRFDGSTWSQVGNPLTVDVGYSSIVALNSTDIAFIDANIEEMRTYHFDGTDWSQIGSGLSIPVLTRPKLARLNSTDVVFIDTSTEIFRVYRWDGIDWALHSEDTKFASAASLAWTSITAINATDFAFIDESVGELRVYRFGFSIIETD